MAYEEGQITRLRGIYLFFWTFSRSAAESLTYGRNMLENVFIEKLKILPPQWLRIPPSDSTIHNP